MNKNMKLKRGFVSVPIAIIVAGLIVAAAIIYSSGKKVVSNEPTANQPVAAQKATDKMRAISDSDHLFGDPKAPVKIVEYSDTECPFCKRFHPTVAKIVSDYKGQVAWIYRYFPLDSLHSRARHEAEAVECAYELGGNDAFWRYLSRIFEVTPSNNGLNPDQLPVIAAYIGLDRVNFESCLNSGRAANRIQMDYDDAIAVGAQGTPFSIVVTPKGDRLPIEGAQSYDAVKRVIDIALGGK